MWWVVGGIPKNLDGCKYGMILYRTYDMSVLVGCEYSYGRKCRHVVCRARGLSRRPPASPVSGEARCGNPK